MCEKTLGVKISSLLSLCMNFRLIYHGPDSMFNGYVVTPTLPSFPLLSTNFAFTLSATIFNLILQIFLIKKLLKVTEPPSRDSKINVSFYCYKCGCRDHAEHPYHMSTYLKIEQCLSLQPFSHQLSFPFSATQITLIIKSKLIFFMRYLYANGFCLPA